MVYLLDKRTNFYYLLSTHQTAIYENPQNVPRILRENANVDLEYFEPDEEKDVLTDMFNKGITMVQYEDMPYTIDSVDILYINPNLSKYYMALMWLNKDSAKNLLWQENLYLLTKIDEKLQFVKIELNKEKYILAFSDYKNAITFLSNIKGYEQFVPVRFPLNRDKKYCVLDKEPFILEQKQKKKEK